MVVMMTIRTLWMGAYASCTSSFATNPSEQQQCKGKCLRVDHATNFFKMPDGRYKREREREVRKEQC
jgi:hypothetical protein